MIDGLLNKLFGVSSESLTNLRDGFIDYIEFPPYVCITKQTLFDFEMCVLKEITDYVKEKYSTCENQGITKFICYLTTKMQDKIKL